MRLRLLVPVFAALLAGCLKEGRPVVGQFLVGGRNVEKPAIVTVAGEPWVTFERRRTPATPPMSATYDFAMVGYDTAEIRPLVENVAERDGWGRQETAGVYYLMADERLVDNPLIGPLPSPVGTLVLLDLAAGELARIPDVSSYILHGGTREFVYRVPTATNRLLELHHRSVDGVDRILGWSSGGVNFLDTGKIYFVLNEDRTLSRILRADAPVEKIRSRVFRYVLSPDESWIALQVNDPGKPSQAIVRQIATGVEHVLPGENPWYWHGFSGSRFVYSEGASPGKPAKLHVYEPATQADEVTVAPGELNDVSGIQRRPRSTDLIYSDSRGRLAIVHPGDEVAGRVMEVSPLAPTVTEDGKYLLYLELQGEMPPEGRLMAQDLDFTSAPRQLSPKGALVPVSPPGYFLIDNGTEPRILVFWAHYGHGSADLYYANYDSGGLQVVANGISEVTVTAHQLVGIVRVSEQDLIGDLVNKDLVLNREIILAHEVVDATVWGPRVAFIIRERISSDRDGLWAIGIDGQPPGAMSTPEP